MLCALCGSSIKLKRNRLIILTEYIGENHNSTAYYWAQIVKFFRKQFDIVLIVPDTNHARMFSQKYGIPARFVKFAKHDKNNLCSRLLGQIRQTLSFLRALRLEIGESDIVFSGTNPIITLFAMSTLRFFKSFKWLVLVHDVFPNNLVPAKVFRESSLAYRFLSVISHFAYRGPDYLICIGRDMKNLLALKLKKDASVKLKYVPNWAPVDNIEVHPKRENEIIKSLGWADKIVFLFFGNMGKLQGISNLLDAIQLSSNEQSRFLFIGSGAEENLVSKVANRVNLEAGYEKIHFFGSLALEDNNSGLNACDVALVSLSVGMFGLGVPSKAYFSLAADKPIIYIGDSGSELDILLGEYDLGWYCEADNSHDLASLFNSVTTNFIESTAPRFNTRNVLEGKLSEQASLSSISAVLEKLSKE